MSKLTKDTIKDTFIELLQQKSLNKITVRDIVDTCGINRNTFYYYYGSIPDLAQAIIKDIVDSLIKENESAKSPMDCLIMAVETALKHKRLLLNIYHSSSREFYEENLTKLLQSVVEHFVDAVFGDAKIDPADREIIIRFYRCECFGQTIEWMNSNMSYDITAQIKRLCEIRRGFMAEAIQRCCLD